MAVDIPVRVTTNSTDYNKKMDGVKDKAQSTSKEFENLGKKIAGIFAVQRIASFAKELTQAAEDVKDMADSFGLTVESLKTIRAIGLYGGVSQTEKIDFILGKLDKYRSAALAGDATAGEAFQKLKISALDLAAPLDVLLDRLAKQNKALQGNNDAADAMFDIFGKNTATMKKFFNEMSMGLDTAREKYKDLGIVFDDAYNEKLDAANNKLKTYWALIKSWSSIALAETIEAFKKIKKAGDETFDSMFEKVNIYEAMLKGQKYERAPGARVELATTVFENTDKTESELRQKILMLTTERDQLLKGASPGSKAKDDLEKQIAESERMLSDHIASVKKKLDEASKPENFEKISAAKALGLRREIERLIEERNRLATSPDTTQGQVVDLNARLKSAAKAYQDHIKEVALQREKAAQMELAAYEKHQEEMEKGRKKGMANTLKLIDQQASELAAKQKRYYDAQEKLESLAFSVADIQRERHGIEKGEKLGSFQANAANSLTAIGGMLGAQSTGMSEAARQTKILQQLKEFDESHGQKMLKIAQETRDSNAIIAGGVE